MANLVSRAELAIWSQKPVPDDSDRASMILSKASELVADAAESPTWLTGPLTAVPRRARTIALLVASREWTNPEHEVAYSIGPLSGRVLDEQAAGMTLTDAERLELEQLGTEDGGSPGGDLYTMSMVPRSTRERVVYIGDNTGSDWNIPYGDFDTTDAFTTDDDTFV